LLSRRRGNAIVRLVRTSDEAELAFQQAEDAREKAKDDESRKSAEELYRRALQLSTGVSGRSRWAGARVDGPQSEIRRRWLKLKQRGACVRSIPRLCGRRPHLSRAGFCRRSSQVISTSHS